MVTRIAEQNTTRTWRRWALLMLIAVILLPLCPRPTDATIVPAPPQAFAQADPVCQATETNTYPDPNGTITPLRRQPYADTIAAPPVVSYSPLARTITFVSGQATLPELKAALTVAYTGTDTLLTETSSKVWLLSKNLVINRAAALTVTDATASALRIESTPAITPSLSVFNYGYVQFNKSKLSSWDTTTNTVDQNYADGRAYYVTFAGGRTDFYTSEISYLGYKDGEASGIAWRKCFNDADHSTGATGDIHDSNIHNNFFGMYSYQANGIWAKNNQMHDNVLYGFDPHDYSDYFIFENNTVTNNGKHGIIFSRWCDYNIIRNNTVSKTTHHGIMLDRRSNFNQIIGNTVFENEDGIAIFQSTDNIIKDNIVHDNLTGIRINATPVPIIDGIIDRTPDQKSLRNQILNNNIHDNLNYGIYLYNRADNTTISGNTIANNGRYDNSASTAYGSGVHIKTGGNTVANNTIKDNGHGVSLLTVDATPDPVGDGDSPGQQPGPTQPNVEPGLPTGSQNTVGPNNVITGSKGRGLRMVGANQNVIASNEIATSGDEGVYSDGGSNNTFDSNNIHDNGAPKGGVDEGTTDLGNYGVNIKGVGANGNKLTKNLITRSGRNAIKLGTNTNNNISAPTLTQPSTTLLSGTALANATVEVFSDPDGEAAVYIGSAVADSGGVWSLSITPQAGAKYAATQTDSANNSSELSSSITSFNVTVAPGRKNEQTIYVAGTDTKVNLAQIQAELVKQSKGDLLTDDGTVDGKRTWTLHASLFISPTVTLNVQGSASVASAQSVQWLRLFSVDGPFPSPNPDDPDHPIYDATKFATIKTYSGNLLFEDTKVTSWDTVNNTLDIDKTDGRAFVLAKYESDLTILRSDMSYLGYADGEAYGVSWRDVNSTADPVDAPRRTRVTGTILDSTFSHNYYGVYTFQAKDMVFRGNKFHDNIQYGFDPHDFTHDVIVENNEAYGNGSHGFIISRGCSNFVFRNNISRDNKVSKDSKNPSAHGFMLDPGADPIKAGVPQAPSVFNLIENNQAYGNDGYAVRVYGSNSNTIRNNTFYNNRAGITLEYGSTGNVIENNTIKDSTGEAVFDAGTGQTTTKGGYGVYAFQGADANIIQGNTITGNINTGIYIKTANNLVQNNTVESNNGDGLGTLLETDSELPPDPPELSAVGNAALTPGAYIADQEPGEWTLAAATTPTGNQFIGNTVDKNLDSGIAIKGATNTLVEQNIVTANVKDGIYIADKSVNTVVRNNSVSGNGGYGIKANGATVLRATLTLNSVMTNSSGGVAVTNGANNGIAQPIITRHSDGTIDGTTVANAIIEIFSDNGKQGQYYEQTLQADATGAFFFRPEPTYRGGYLVLTATDANGNTSSYSTSVASLSGYKIYMPVAGK